MSHYTERDLRRVDQAALVLTAVGVTFALSAWLGARSPLHMLLLAVGFVALGAALATKVRTLRRAGGREPEPRS